MVDQRVDCGLEISAVANRSKGSTTQQVKSRNYIKQGNKTSVRSWDYGEMLDDGSIDLVVITSHTDAHREHALALSNLERRSTQRANLGYTGRRPAR